MKLAPTILIDRTTFTPSNHMWLLAFALSGCQWAIDAITKLEDNFLWLGDGI